MNKLLLLCLVLSTSAYSQCPSLTCFASFNISLDENAEAVLEPEMIVFGDHSDCTLEISLFDTEGNELIAGDTSIMVNCDHLGDLVIQVQDVVTEAACFATISTSDMMDLCEPSSIADLLDIDPYYSHGYLHLGRWSDSATEVEIYDVNGRLIHTTKAYGTSIELAFLPPSQMYIISLSNQSNKESFRILM